MGTGKSNKHTMQDLAVGSISKNAHSGQSHKSKKRKSSVSEPSKSKKAKTLKKKSSSKKSTSKSTSSHNEDSLNNTTGTNETSTTSKSKPSTISKSKASTISKSKASTISKPTTSSRRRLQEEIKPKECFICHQLELPDEVRIKLKLPENYQKKLEETKDKRRPGCTGYGDIWDPRVLIKCRDCNNFIHCGCPEIPITRYDPKKRQVHLFLFTCLFICLLTLILESVLTNCLIKIEEKPLYVYSVITPKKMIL
jgi:hypothetical protein